MSFDWNRYSVLADTWKSSVDEELRRCSVSRAYYSFYHSLRIFKSITTKRQPHNVVVEALKSSLDADEMYLAKLLKDLQENRETVDYDGVKPVDAKFVEGFFLRLDEAKELHDLIKP